MANVVHVPLLADATYMPSIGTYEVQVGKLLSCMSGLRVEHFH